MTGVSRTSCSSKSVPTRAARRRSASSSRSRIRSGTSAPGRANARLRRSSRPGRSVSATMSRTAAEQQPEDDRGVAGPEVDVALDDRVPEPAQDVGGAVQRVADVGGEAAEHARRERLGDGDPQRGAARRRRAAVNVPGDSVSASSMIPESSTERVSAPKTIQWLPSRSCGARGTRPRCGLRPNRPVQAAGMRIEPAPSAASAAGTIPAATAAAEPPLDPPGVRLGVPRVAGDAPGHRLRERPEPQLGHRGLADDHRAGGAQAADDLRVGGRGDGERVGPPAREVAGDVDLVLDGDRHPQQRRRPRLPRAGGRPRRPSVSARSA